MKTHTNQATQIRRNSFARMSLMRRTAPRGTARTPCNWCGDERRSRRMFYYYWESDGGTKGQAQGPFCCIHCYLQYTGERL
ncbi:MAG TPA: hypothetical protein VK673_21925 [Chthoniobacterales bacterium]|nr:hypothetical protein [Chthoniobacterales bacterium]